MKPIAVEDKYKNLFVVFDRTEVREQNIFFLADKDSGKMFTEVEEDFFDKYKFKDVY